MKTPYFIFGLKVLSQIALPAPPVLEAGPDWSADVTIEMGETPDHLITPSISGAGIQAAPGEFLLSVDTVARYYIRAGCSITVTPDAKTDPERVLIFLLGSAFGALLHQRNILVLHAGAIIVNGQSVIFSGDSGVGKSTLTAGFHQRGYRFLADDVCAIAGVNKKPAVIPGFPRLKLWADVLEKLNTDKDLLKSVRWTQGMDKYLLPVRQEQKDPVPLKAVFIMESAGTDTIDIAALKGMDKISPIIANTYRLGFLNGLGGKEEHFRQCAAVADQTRVYRVTRPEKGFLLAELMDHLEAKFNG
jgi:hypothetical protein